MTLRLFARDASLRRTGQIEDYRTLTTPLRFNKVSGWVLTLDAASAGARLLTRGAGLIVERDGVTLLSGPVTGLETVLDADRETLVVTGVDDTVWLDRRLALPVPAGPPYTAAAYDTTSGPAETVMQYYVDRNLGPAATAARRLAGLTLPADQGRGSTVYGAARFHTLLELLQTLALAGGDLGFRIVQVGTGLQFQVYAPADRTKTALFSRDFGNLRGYQYKLTVPTADYLYVAGQGEGTARTIVEGSDAAAVARDGRFESFVDQRDTADPAALAQSLTENLAEKAATTSLSLSPIDTAAVTFGRDYLLGDRVTAVIGGTVIKDVVREVVLGIAGDGVERLTPVVGTPNASNPAVPDLFDRQAAQERRLSQIERR